MERIGSARTVTGCFTTEFWEDVTEASQRIVRYPEHAVRASSAGLVGIFASKYGRGGEKLNLQKPYVIFKIGNM